VSNIPFDYSQILLDLKNMTGQAVTSFTVEPVNGVNFSDQMISFFKFDPGFNGNISLLQFLSNFTVSSEDGSSGTQGASGFFFIGSGINDINLSSPDDVWEGTSGSVYEVVVADSQRADLLYEMRDLLTAYMTSPSHRGTLSGDPDSMTDTNVGTYITQSCDGYYLPNATFSFVLDEGIPSVKPVKYAVTFHEFADDNTPMGPAPTSVQVILRASTNRGATWEEITTYSSQITTEDERVEFDVLEVPDFYNAFQVQCIATVMSDAENSSMKVSRIEILTDHDFVKYRKNTAAWSHKYPVGSSSGDPLTINDGITIYWSFVSGHTEGDYWVADRSNDRTLIYTWQFKELTSGAQWKNIISRTTAVFLAGEEYEDTYTLDTSSLSTVVNTIPLLVRLIVSSDASILTFDFDSVLMRVIGESS
jgi:hypothetical protein